MFLFTISKTWQLQSTCLGSAISTAQIVQNGIQLNAYYENMQQYMAYIFMCKFLHWQVSCFLLIFLLGVCAMGSRCGGLWINQISYKFPFLYKKEPMYIYIHTESPATCILAWLRSLLIYALPSSCIYVQYVDSK